MMFIANYVDKTNQSARINTDKKKEDTIIHCNLPWYQGNTDFYTPYM